MATTALAPDSGEPHAPAWLQSQVFEAPDFNPEACIAELRRYVPLGTLKAELEEYSSRLQSQLVEVVNNDYNDYVNLSTRLVNVEGAIVRMRKPLGDIQVQLANVRGAVAAELAALDAGLLKRQEVAKQRATLELCQEVAHVAPKVDKLLEEFKAAGGDAADLDAASRLAERVAGEAARLSFLASKGQGLAFVESMAPRIRGARAQLDTQLEALLARALQQRAWPAAVHCLHALLELGEASRGSAAVRTEVVAPVVAAALAAHKRGPGEQATLSALLRPLLDSLQAEAGPLLSVLLAPGSVLSGVDVLGAGVLAEVNQQLGEKLPGAFSAGVPAAFHANFLAGQAFLAQLEALCPSRAAVEQLRASAAWAAWGKRWNLAVYFSLTYQDVAGTLETAARTDSMAPAPSGAGDGDGLRLAVTAAAWAALQRCASPGTFLVQLADRFFKLSCQVVGRYRTWLAEVEAARREAAAAAATAGAAASPGAAPPPAAPPSPPPAGVATGPAAWAGGVSSEELALVVVDAQRFRSLVSERFAPQVAGLLEALPGGVAAAAEVALRAAAAGVGVAAEQLLLALGQEATERCVAVVRQLKGITATYRMTSKGPPTRHSHYAAGVLAPLAVLLEAPNVRELDAAARGALVASVVGDVSARYQQLGEELLTQVRKTESSLKRLKKGRGGAGDAGDAAAAGEGMSDSDKICLQLHLDVEEFGRQASKLGALPDELPQYVALRASVAPAASPDAHP